MTATETSAERVLTCEAVHSKQTVSPRAHSPLSYSEGAREQVHVFCISERTWPNAILQHLRV